MTLWVANAIHADLRALPPWVFWVSVSFSVAVECLFLYVVLLLTRWEHFWRARE
jgi:hypothetical protein